MENLRVTLKVAQTHLNFKTGSRPETQAWNPSALLTPDQLVPGPDPTRDLRQHPTLLPHHDKTADPSKLFPHWWAILPFVPDFLQPPLNLVWLPALALLESLKLAAHLQATSHRPGPMPSPVSMPPS